MLRNFIKDHLGKYYSQFQGHLHGLLWSAKQFLKGHLVFHAASFSLGNKWYALLGQSGQGKSSMLAALSLLPEIQVLGDDVLAFQTESQDWVWPQPEQLEIRLWKEAADQLNWPNFNAAEKVHPLHEKRRLPLEPACLDGQCFGGFIVLHYGQSDFFQLKEF